MERAVGLRGGSRVVGRRDTTVRFDAGARVYELIDDAGAVYVMQSYSLQVQPLMLASLETLGRKELRLMFPPG